MVRGKPLKRIVNGRAVASLILSRAIYAVNWYNVSSVFALIALDFRENVAGLGILTASFYLGLGLFQVPGGIMAAKYGPRRTGICGTVISSSAALLTAFTSQFYQITVLRFIVGLGMAMVFAPGVTLIAKYFRNRAEGLGVGLFNAAFYVGGAFGLFGWAVLAEFVGWRPSIAVSGILGILTAIFMIFMVPKDNMREDFPIRITDLRRILSNKWLLILTLELFGVGSGSTLVTTFMVFYLEDSLKTVVALAGIVGGLSLFLAILASPIFGRIYDRTKNARRLLFLSGLGLSFGIAVASIGTLYAAIISTIIVGLCQGGAFTVGFVAAREAQLPDSRYETLAVSWVNSVSLFAGFWSPVAFSLLVIRFGYASAWLLAGVYTLFLISIILMSKHSPQ
jgi:MFS family permease